MRKSKVVILNQLKIKKIKSTNNFEKNHNKKTIKENTVVIHSVLKKKITKLNF